MEALAEAYGVLLYCNTFTGSAVRVVTESRDFAERLPKLFRKAFGVGFDETGVSKYADITPAADFDSLEQVFVITQFEE